MTRCRQEDLANTIGKADILVPLMARLNPELLEQAKKAKLILQYGVGLESVDIEAVNLLSLTITFLDLCILLQRQPP